MAAFPPSYNPVKPRTREETEAERVVLSKLWPAIGDLGASQELPPLNESALMTMFVALAAIPHSLSKWHSDLPPKVPTITLEQYCALYLLVIFENFDHDEFLKCLSHHRVKRGDNEEYSWHDACMEYHFSHPGTLRPFSNAVPGVRNKFHPFTE